ncbi:MAG TPA: PQQ-dependent sugar dehydrogenase [Synergistales bacterium]|nr:PQQ-dependent sugar dehydrogenase [Synergistales bacterium]
MSAKTSGYLRGSVLLLLIFFSSMTGQAICAPVTGGPPQSVEDVLIADPAGYRVEPWVENLDIPWSLVFLTEERALVTERKGSIRLIERGLLEEEPYMVIGDTAHSGEGGLMGIAKHPLYPGEPFIYVMYTYRRDGGTVLNRVTRYRDTGTSMEPDRIIIEGIPGHSVHNGGRISFGPDGMLYICTGDTSKAGIAQDLANLGGKILRLTPDGNVPNDNPFRDSPVFSLGHRNPQGLAWHPERGDLFSSEHGPSGEFGLRARDEINSIIPGGNYGWPIVVGAAGKDPFIDPLIMWPRATPPSGMAFWDDSLFVATLRSKALLRIELQASGEGYNVKGIERLFATDWSNGTFGRLRDAVAGPDGALYVLTSNRDGRGSPLPGDDRILRITLK